MQLYTLANWKHTMLLLLALFMYGNIQAQAAAEPAKTELPKLKKADLYGVWKPTKAVMNNTAMPDTFVSSIRLLMQEKFYSTSIGKEVDKGELDIQIDSIPMRMAIKSQSGPNAGKTIYCIFRMVEGKMEVLYDLSGKQYPKAFTENITGDLYLAVYQKL